MLREILIAVLVIALAYTISSQNYSDLTGLVFDNKISAGGIAQALGIMALVIITSYYAIQTRRTLAAINKSTETSVLPHLKCSMGVVGVDTLFLKISNVGVGSAINVNLEYEVESISNSSREWMSSIMLPEESYQFYIMNPQNVLIGMNYCSKNQTTIIVNGSYDDILGNNHEISETINVTEISAKLLRSGQMIRIEDMKEISTSLKSIQRDLTHLRRDYHNFTTNP